MKTDKNKAEKALKTLEKQYKRQNEYIKANYDRISVTLPKGYKTAIVNNYDSVNGFIRSAIEEKLNRDGIPVNNNSFSGGSGSAGSDTDDYDTDSLPFH